MNLTHTTSLTIVAEAILETTLVASLQRLGVNGWTMSDARGFGSRNRRASHREGANIRIEVLADAQIIHRIWEELESQFFNDYAVIAWETEVKISRAEISQARTSP
jgi:nitrogen regulatory protein PII